MKPYEAVPRFLQSIGRDAEAQFYLSLFRAEAKESFAAIALESSIVRESPNAAVADLRFLSKMGLTPVVVLGLDDPAGAERDAAGLSRQLHEATTPATMIKGIDTAAMIAAARRGELPLAPITAVSREQWIAELGRMLSALRTRKLIFLQDEGGLRRNGAAISVVNLTSEFEELMASSALSARQKELLNWSRWLIFEKVSHQLLAALTSPLHLLFELFTVRGAGTLLRRGAQIEVYQGLQQLDTGRLSELFAASSADRSRRISSPGLYRTPTSRKTTRARR